MGISISNISECTVAPIKNHNKNNKHDCLKCKYFSSWVIDWCYKFNKRIITPKGDKCFEKK